MIRAVLAPEPVRIVSSRPLFYSDGADPAADRPAHVRSASALAPWKDELLVVQDDANFFAVVGESGVRAIELPRGHGGLRCFDDLRGNKAHKLDLESCIVLPDGRLVAFGSGSTAARGRLVVLGEDEIPAIVDGVPYSFTDALGLGSDRYVFLAVAEDSPDAVADGAIYGVALGVLENDRARMNPIVGERGAPSLLKLEGLARIDDTHFRAVADADDPAAPSILCALELA